MSRRSLCILLTVAVWLTGTVIYGSWWVNNVLDTETLYGYERSRLLISTAFLAYRFPHLLIALAFLIVLELLLVPRLSKERTP